MCHQAFCLDTSNVLYEKTVSDLWFPFFFFFNSTLWFTNRGKRRKKASEALNVAVKAEAGMCPLFFVSICGTWWMCWVDVIIWLITQVLHKNSHPMWVDTGKLGNQLLHCPEGDSGGETGELLRKDDSRNPHIHCSWPPNGGGVFLGPAVSPSWSKSTSNFDEVNWWWWLLLWNRFEWSGIPKISQFDFWYHY